MTINKIWTMVRNRAHLEVKYVEIFNLLRTKQMCCSLSREVSQIVYVMT